MPPPQRPQQEKEPISESIDHVLIGGLKGSRVYPALLTTQHGGTALEFF
jgi:hypothetical protein